MTDIIIYTKKETVEKKRNSEHSILFWTLPHYPKRFSESLSDGDRVLFAYDGAIQGVFWSTEQWTSDAENPIPDTAIKFSRLMWRELPEPIPTKQFQGFKYADKVPGLVEIVDSLYE